MKKFLLALPLLALMLGACANLNDKSVSAPHDAAIAENMRQGFVEEIPLGNMTVLGIVDSPHTFKKDEIRNNEKYEEIAAIMPNGDFRALVKTYLVKDGERLILIDSGWGVEQGKNGCTLEILEERGIKPGDVTDILLTHMDIDHIGGLVRNGMAVYPTATLHLSGKELQAWQKGDVDRSKPQIEKGQEMLNAYKGRVKSFGFDEEIMPGITARDASGHTPGHTAYAILSDKNGLTVVGDLAHIAPLQFSNPDISTVYDTIPQAVESRKHILDGIERQKYLIAGMHFPEVGKLERKGQNESYKLIKR